MESSPPRTSRFTETVGRHEVSPLPDAPTTSSSSTDPETRTTTPPSSPPSPPATVHVGTRTSTPSPSPPPKPQPPPPPYSAFPARRRRLILTLVTAAGFLGPLSGTIYLPAIPSLARDLGISVVAVDATVSVFMVVFAFAVSTAPPPPTFPVAESCTDDAQRDSRSSGPVWQTTRAVARCTSSRWASSCSPTRCWLAFRHTMPRWSCCASSRLSGRRRS